MMYINATTATKKETKIKMICSNPFCIEIGTADELERNATMVKEKYKKKASDVENKLDVARNKGEVVVQRPTKILNGINHGYI